MRILIYGLNFFPELTGIGKYTAEMASHLAHKGNDIRVLTAPPYYPYWRVQAPYRACEYVREKWENVHVYRCPIWVPQQATGTRRVIHLVSFTVSSLPVLLMQCAWRPKVVIVIAPAISVAPSGLLLARLSGAKAWLHIQDFELDAALNLGLLSKRAHTRLLHAVERRLLLMFDVVSTLSEGMSKQLQLKGINKESIKLIRNWVDTRLIQPETQDGNHFRKAHSLCQDDVVLLYAGSMGKKQGLEVVIDVARRLKHLRNLHFVLSGEGAIRKSLVALSDGLLNVHFLPLQPPERLNSLLNMADIHLLPQRADAADLVMPSKLSGMLASGRPVIATAQPGTELAAVIAQIGVLVPPENPIELTKAILSLAQNKDLREKLGHAGRQYAVEHWDKEKVLNHFSEQLESLVREKG